MSLAGHPRGVDGTAPERLRRQAGDAFLQRMLQSFLVQAPRVLSDLPARVQRGDDLAQVADDVHRLRGSVGLVGALVFHDLLTQLEQGLRRRRAQRVPVLLRRLAEEHRRVAPWFQGQVQLPPPPP